MSLLIAPWICVILGWTYLVNDDKISTIGRYLREDLTTKINTILNIENDESVNENHKNILGWETFHRSDNRRKRRKFEQFFIDQITFVLSGLTALVYFWLSVNNKSIPIKIICGLELFLLLFLAIEICLYADFNKDSQFDNDRG